MSLPNLFRLPQAILVSGALMFATTASAQNFFFDRPAFTAALGTTQVNDLNALGDGSTVISFGALGTGTLSGTTVTGGRINNTETPFTFTITFSRLLDGFGADFLNEFGSPGDARFVFFNGATEIQDNGLYGGSTFKGVIPPGGAFDRVVVTEIPTTGSSPALFSSVDNLTVGVLAPVPEPATVALFALGLATICGVAVRRKRKAGGEAQQQRRDSECMLALGGPIALSAEGAA